jgi:hypothetical protein
LRRRSPHRSRRADFDDQRSHVPLLSVFGVDGGAVADAMTPVRGGDRGRHANRPDADVAQ